MGQNCSLGRETEETDEDAEASAALGAGGSLMPWCSFEHERALAQLRVRLVAERVSWQKELAGVSMHAVTPFDRPQTKTGRQLQVEVLFAEDLGKPAYRIGDIVSRRHQAGWGLHAYAKVELGGVVHQTRAVHGPLRGRTDFGERLSFSLEGEGEMSAASILRIRVFDSRGVQSVLRGDPLIGEARHTLSTLAVDSSVQRLQLLRDGQQLGFISIRCGLIAAENSYGVLASSHSHSFAEVAVALSEVLSQPQGIDMLLAARPADFLAAYFVYDEDEVRAMLASWVRRLIAQVGSLAAAAPGAALSYTRSLARGALDIVAVCARGAGGDEIVAYAVAWLQTLFAGVAGPWAAEAVDTAWLEEILRVGRAHQEGRATLEAFDVKLPRGSDPDVAAALLERLLEAEHAKEDEMFTGEPLVVAGRLADGMAAVIRPGGDGRPHVFLYDHASIRKWQSDRGVDPMTREQLQMREILELGSC